MANDQEPQRLAGAGPVAGGDPDVAQELAAESDLDEAQAAKMANRFDIRRIIGGLFVIYGLILLITGLAGSSYVRHKAAGINVDLWTGVGMLVFGALMLGWALTRPTLPEPPETRGEGSGRLRRAPAT